MSGGAGCAAIVGERCMRSVHCVKASSRIKQMLLLSPLGRMAPLLAGQVGLTRKEINVGGHAFHQKAAWARSRPLQFILPIRTARLKYEYHNCVVVGGMLDGAIL